IRGNHVARVEEGRAGPDVFVADGQIKPEAKRKTIMSSMKKLAKKLLIKSGFAADEAEVVEAAEKLVEAVGEEVAEKALEPGAPNFDEEAAKILADTELDDPGKIAALKALAEGTKAEGTPEKKAADNDPENKAMDDEPEKKPEAADAADFSPEELAELMKGAGLDPSDEVAGKAFLAGMKAGQGAKDNEPEAEDNNAPGKKAADSGKEEKPLTAQDAALIRKQAKREAASETKAHFRGLAEAARSVRGLCGELDPLAFDSAEDIYRHALKSSGREVTTRDAAALRDMVKMALDAKANANRAHIPPFESRKIDGQFSGLNRINIQQ
ncbi:MAG: DUF2213 domain-containing protein, partial [Desulfovibrio sp.]|nr:DUF2213 domain-containing protein [Desulfovibrio sp.]